MYHNGCMRKGFVIVPLVLLLIYIPYAQVYGQFQLDQDSVDIEFDSNSEPTARPTRTPTPSLIPARDYILYDDEKKQFDEEGFAVRTAYPFQKQASLLTVDLSSIKIGFANVQPNTPQEKSVSFSVQSPGVYSYQTLAWQTSLLKTTNNLQIENTQCDSVIAPCSVTMSRKWTLNQAPGFGYRLEGSDAPLDFLVNTYRVFPLESHKAASLYAETTIQNKRPGILYLKLNAPPTFQEGSYTTTLKILTLPRL